MEYDVTIDRDKYIGGSDIPVLMGISKYKSRFDLLLEKAGLKERDFGGNEYTEYGHKLEPHIRDYINSFLPDGDKYEPNRIIHGDLRLHTDGFNGWSVLEIKTTSHIFDDLDEYKVYLVQLLKYMQENNVSRGLLAVYERDKAMSEEFDPERLHTHEVDINAYASLLAEVNEEIDRFRADLERLKENPLLVEADFIPYDLVAISEQVRAFEIRIAEFKAEEARHKELKRKLFDDMAQHNITSWTMPCGTKITRVDGIPDTIESVEEFDLEAFKQDFAELAKKYTNTVDKKKPGRAGYVKITIK